LFGTRRGLTSARITKAFFLFELAREDADQSRLADFAHELTQLDDTFARALANLCPVSDRKISIADPLHAGDEAFGNLEIDRALDLYLQAPPSLKRHAQLIRCAEDIETPEVAKRVVDAISLAGDSEKLPTSWSKRLCKLEQLCATPQEQLDPPDWLAWARRVEE